jgi:hypothetical protein
VTELIVVPILEIELELGAAVEDKILFFSGVYF